MSDESPFGISSLLALLLFSTFSSLLLFFFFPLRVKCKLVRRFRLGPGPGLLAVGPAVVPIAEPGGAVEGVGIAALALVRAAPRDERHGSQSVPSGTVVPKFINPSMEIERWGPLQKWPDCPLPYYWG